MNQQGKAAEPGRIPDRVRELLEQFTECAREIFGQTLTGVYLHGSLAMNCFHPDKSDVDLIVVVEEGIGDREKLQFMEKVVELNRGAPKKGIEMSVVKRADCGKFVYPTPYELHFSPAHLEWYLRDPRDYVRGMRGTDRDLAAHFTILRRFGIVLAGAPIEEVFAPVPREDYVDSIWRDVRNAKEEVGENPVYIILNLCRVAAFLEAGLVLSKQQGGEWGAANLPGTNRKVILAALRCYTCAPGSGEEPDRTQAAAFCEAMLPRIRRSIRG